MATATRKSKNQMASYGSGFQPSPASVSRPGKKKGEPTCSGLSISKVENGFTVSKRYDHNDRVYWPSKEHVFTTLADVQKFVEKSLGKLTA